MPGRVRLNREELAIIISNIERNGGDASQLRELLSLKGTDSSDADDVKILMEQSPSKEGPGLRCLIYGSETPRLISDSCEGCFTHWALSTKRKKDTRKVRL
jgi:hypothetical protein